MMYQMNQHSQKIYLAYSYKFGNSCQERNFSKQNRFKHYLIKSLIKK